MINRQLLIKLKDYLSAKQEPTEQELAMIQEIEEELKHFIISTINRDELPLDDVSNIDDEMMEKIADGMADEANDDTFSIDLDTVLKDLELKEDVQSA